MKIIIIAFLIFCIIVVAAAILYLVVSIEVHNEMREAKKIKDKELSLKEHDWKGFKNYPWVDDVRHFN